MTRELAPEHEAAIVAFFGELEEVFGSVGRHQGHALEKVGRCVYCSCNNFRYQGDVPTDAERAECAAAFAARTDTASLPNRGNVMHLAPTRGDGLLPCCGQTIYDVPAGSVTIIPGEVTCPTYNADTRKRPPPQRQGPLIPAKGSTSRYQRVTSTSSPHQLR